MALPSSLSNRIIYNRIKRGILKILRINLFEQNDDYTRHVIDTQVRTFLKQVKTNAIHDFELYIHPFDAANPHHIVIDVIIHFKLMIEQVMMNITNDDYL